MSTEPAISFSAVTKRYRGYLALDALQLQVARGCVFGLLGPNGAGKTTTLRLVTGVLGADEGVVRVLGAAPGAARVRLGFLPEEKGLYRRMRVLDYLIFFARLKGLDHRSARRSSLQWLDRFGIADRARTRCEELSKGLGQKLQIATALVHEPELVILDEPFSGLDPVNVDLVRTLVKELRERGRTVVLSTHDMTQAELLCDELLLLHRGQCVLAGATADVLRAGPSCVRITYRGTAPDFLALPGVATARDTGQQVELQLVDGASGQALLHALLNLLQIDSFDTRNASLHEIFMREIGARLTADAVASSAVVTQHRAIHR